MKSTTWLQRWDGDDLTFIAKTFKGFEPLLEKELVQLGAREVKPLNRAVQFNGDMGFLYKAGLGLSTALRILWPLATFQAEDADALYTQAVQLPWSEIIRPDQRFAIQYTVNSELFSHSQFAALKLKDALVDAMRKQTGKRPDVDRNDPDLVIDLMIAHDQVHLALDASGIPLFKRGYRKDTGKAPLNEVLAAGLIRMSGWDGRKPLFDPFCGSGTLLIEACMYHMDIPPGLFRESFGFQRWKNYDASLFDKIRETRIDRVKEPMVEIVGSDRDEWALEKAFANIQQAGMGDMIRLEQADFFKSGPPFNRNGFLIGNPPYGEKLKLPSDEFFVQIGDTLKREYAGWEAWLIIPETEKGIGLKPKAKFPILNGDIACKWSGYQLFEGTHKSRRQGGSSY